MLSYAANTPPSPPHKQGCLLSTSHWWPCLHWWRLHHQCSSRWVLCLHWEKLRHCKFVWSWWQRVFLLGVLLVFYCLFLYYFTYELICLLIEYIVCPPLFLYFIFFMFVLDFHMLVCCTFINYWALFYLSVCAHFFVPYNLRLLISFSMFVYHLLISYYA